MTARKTTKKKTKKTAKSSARGKAKATRASASGKKKSARAPSAMTRKSAARKSASRAGAAKMSAKKSSARKTVTKKATRSTSKPVKATKAARATKSAKATPSTKAKATRTMKQKKVLKVAKAPKQVPRSSGTTIPAAPSAPPRPTPTPLDQGDAKHFEQLLIAERERLMREMGQFEDNVLNRSLRDSSGELSGYAFHMADIGTDSMEREKAFLFASAEGRVLIDVNDALRRLYNGQYGTCESCEGPIGRPRLEVVPHARLCVNCKEIEERRQAGRAR